MNLPGEDIAGPKVENEVIIPQARIGNAELRLDQGPNMVGENPGLVPPVDGTAEHIQRAEFSCEGGRRRMIAFPLEGDLAGAIARQKWVLLGEFNCSSV